jgi:hypothetical protein
MFAQITRVVAILMLVTAVVQYALGLAIASEWLGPYEEAMGRYGRFFSSSGEMINKATYQAGIALALGTLAEIALSLRRRPS